MIEGSYSARTNAFDPSATIVDASGFGSYPHCLALCEAGESGLEFFVSAALYSLLYEQSDRARVLDTLGHFLWRYPGSLPFERLELRSYLRPYSFRREYVEEIWDYYEASRLPPEVKRVILDEYSFLKQHSVMLLNTRRIAKHLHGWGIVLLDATNKLYDGKRPLFERIRGARWIIGTLLASAGVQQVSGNPVLDNVAAVGGVVLALLDP